MRDVGLDFRIFFRNAQTKTDVSVRQDADVFLFEKTGSRMPALLVGDFNDTGRSLALRQAGGIRNADAELQAFRAVDIGKLHAVAFHLPEDCLRQILALSILIEKIHCAENSSGQRFSVFFLTEDGRGVAVFKFRDRDKNVGMMCHAYASQGSVFLKVLAAI